MPEYLPHILCKHNRQPRGFGAKLKLMQRKMFWIIFMVLGLAADFIFPFWWALAAAAPILFVSWWIAYRSDWF